jgi:hypothetical protein
VDDGMLLPLEMASNERFGLLSLAQQDQAMKHFAWKVSGHQKQPPLTDEQVNSHSPEPRLT